MQLCKLMNNKNIISGEQKMFGKNTAYGKMEFAGIMVLAVFLLWLSPAYGGGAITETFTDTDNPYNTQLWRLRQEFGQGATPLVINKRLEVTVAGNGYAIFQGWGFTLIGDFDMRVDFTLINWPASNGTKLTIGTFLEHETGTIWPEVGRANAPWDTIHGPEVYFTSMTNFNNIGVTGPSLSGTLRLVRTGNKVEGFYWDGAVWKSVGAGNDASFGGRVGVHMFIGPCGGTYSGIPAKAAFDNIQITYTTLGPGFEQGGASPAIMGLLLN
jgi:hypothetical protein